MTTISVVIPAKNEELGLADLLPGIVKVLPEAEVIVVDDGSTDRTAEIAQKNGAKVVSHPESIGNGGAIKSGARAARGEILCFLDADGQHQPKDLIRLLEQLESGFDMVVGAREPGSQASPLRGIGNGFYNKFSSLIVGRKILDLTSGLRVVKGDKFREFLYLLPNKFSYPTTITMAFFRSGYSVGYAPIHALERKGKSHLRIWRDGIRFLIIIFKIATLYSPLKVFIPVAFAQFVIGCSYYLYTFIEHNRFTNMSALMLTSAVTVFLIGLVSEQITTLMYKSKE